MAWSERQRGMLAEMGIRLWATPHLDRQQDRTPLPPAQRGDGAGAAPFGEQDSTSLPPARRGNGGPFASPGSGVGETSAVAPPGGVEAMGWDALREAVAGCTACGLASAGRRQAVFGVGNVHAHWMVVGEAPGEQEDLRGEPFVGPSGQLLDNMLKALGLSRHETPPPGGEGSPSDPARQVYIANTLKCRPPRNRNPQPDELAQCERFLVRQIALVQPRIVLAMGRFAVQALLRTDEPIGRLRGRVHRYQGVPLVVTYHPAYLLRNLEDKARAWDDLCLAAETAAA